MDGLLRLLAFYVPITVSVQIVHFPNVPRAPSTGGPAICDLKLRFAERRTSTMRGPQPMLGCAEKWSREEHL